MKIEDPATYDPTPGDPVLLEPGVRRILAPNPSPMTHRGTNTYLVGEGDVALIDPGPNDRAHLASILSSMRPGERITHIFVTHSHLDHSGLAAPLARATGAPVLAFGASDAGRSPIMTELLKNGLESGGEGSDRGFLPDETLADEEEVHGADWSISALWTPGHFGNHMCFTFGSALFSGDHVMGWASTMVSPPDGDIAAFMESTEMLSRRSDRIFYPGHGGPITSPVDRATELVAHRRAREAQILQALADAPAGVSEITRRIYVDTPPQLLPAAQRNVFAHLIDLVSKSVVLASPNLSTQAKFSLR